MFTVFNRIYYDFRSKFIYTRTLLCHRFIFFTEKLQWGSKNIYIIVWCWQSVVIAITLNVYIVSTANLSFYWLTSTTNNSIYHFIGCAYDGYGNNTENYRLVSVDVRNSELYERFNYSWDQFSRWNRRWQYYCGKMQDSYYSWHYAVWLNALLI